MNVLGRLFFNFCKDRRKADSFVRCRRTDVKNILLFLCYYIARYLLSLNFLFLSQIWRILHYLGIFWLDYHRSSGEGLALEVPAPTKDK